MLFPLATLLFATGINVSPVQLHLTKDESKTQIDVKNDGDEPARFQLSLFVWGEDPDKGMQLQPTQDVVFFPSLLALKAGEQRSVRVGVLPQQFGLVEKTYRLFVEELPGVERPNSRSSVRVLTRVGIPIFLDPVRKLDTAAVELRVQPGAVVTDVRNTGNVHVRVLTVALKAFDAQGTPLIEKQQQGWYILANGRKSYRFELPQGTCAKARRLIASVHTDDDRNFSQALDTPAGACGR